MLPKNKLNPPPAQSQKAQAAIQINPALAPATEALPAAPGLAPAGELLFLLAQEK
jgi:hypothetical protein